MDLNNLSSIVALLIALSVASERLVEIVKGLSRFLSEENPNNAKERYRRVLLQALAVGAGIVTTFFASPALPATVIPDSWPAKLALGLLASGGSGFWNSVQTYVARAKDLKKAESEEKKAETEAKKVAVHGANAPA